MSEDITVEEFLLGLGRWDDRFIEACRAVLKLEIPDHAAYGVIWYQYDDTIDGLPLCHMWFDEGHGAQVTKALNGLTGEQWNEPADIDDLDRGTILFRWIHRCWESAGGASSAIPYYCLNYHTGETYCLRRGRYVSEREIEEDFGGTARS